MTFEEHRVKATENVDDTGVYSLHELGTDL